MDVRGVHGALTASARAHSSVLLAFGSDSVIELLSATCRAAAVFERRSPQCQSCIENFRRPPFRSCRFRCPHLTRLTLFRSRAQAQYFRHLHHRGRAHRHAGAQCCEKPFRSCHGKRRPGSRFRSIGNLRLSRRHYLGGTGSERAFSSSLGGFNRGARSYANSHHGRQTCNSRRELWLLLDRY